MAAKDTMSDFLAQHPRMIGVLFTLLIVLSQAGTATAASNSHIGP